MSGAQKTTEGTAPIAANGRVDRDVGRLLPCPCCGAPASVGFKRNASLGLHGWVSDCTICTDASVFHRFTREAAVESWNNYASQPVTPNAAVTGGESEA